MLGNPLIPRPPTATYSRPAFAAAHVINDPVRQLNPWDSRPAVDWNATLGFRQTL